MVPGFPPYQVLDLGPTLARFPAAVLLAAFNFPVIQYQLDYTHDCIVRMTVQGVWSRCKSVDVNNNKPPKFFIMLDLVIHIQHCTIANNEYIVHSNPSFSWHFRSYWHRRLQPWFEHVRHSFLIQGLEYIDEVPWWLSSFPLWILSSRMHMLASQRVLAESVSYTQCRWHQLG